MNPKSPCQNLKCYEVVCKGRCSQKFGFSLQRNRKALEKIMQDTSQKPETRLSAEGFTKKILQLEISLLALFWNDVLKRTNKSSNNLQKEPAQKNFKHFTCY